MEKQLDVLTSWIENDETFLDPSQSLAIKHALENRISIIQGPPGTGKVSHISSIYLSFIQSNNSHHFRHSLELC